MRLLSNVGRTSFLALLLSACCVGSASAQVKVELYTGFQEDTATNTIAFSDLVQTFTSSAIRFGFDNNDEWFPLAPDFTSFGARLTGTITVPTTGDYTFILRSDDGSYLRLNSDLFIANPGVHAPQSVSNTINLQGGVNNPFEIQFYQGPLVLSALDLLYVDPTGAEVLVPDSFFIPTPSDVPEPGTVALLAGCGVAGGMLLRRRR